MLTKKFINELDSDILSEVDRLDMNDLVSLPKVDRGDYLYLKSESLKESFSKTTDASVRFLINLCNIYHLLPSTSKLRDKVFFLICFCSYNKGAKVTWECQNSCTML